MNYDEAIESVEHAKWCLAEAARRYKGRTVFNSDGFPLIEDARGVCHTNSVLRTIGANWSEHVIAGHQHYDG